MGATGRISDQLRQAIKADPRSDYALAAAAGVPRSALSRYLAGKSDLTGATLEKLAAALKLGLAPIAPPLPKRSRSRRAGVEADQGGGRLRQVEAAGPAVEKIGIYWRAGQPFLHLRVKGRAVALEQHSTRPAYLAAGLVYVGLADLPQLVYHGPAGDVPLRGFTADPAAARFYREFLGYCRRPDLWPPESERGVEVMEVNRPADDEPDDDEAGEE